MWVISRKKLCEFWEVHEDGQAPLARWYTLTEGARWGSFEDVRKTFGKTVDRFGTCYVFDIHGAVIVDPAKTDIWRMK